MESVKHTQQHRLCQKHKFFILIQMGLKVDSGQSDLQIENWHKNVRKNFVIALLNRKLLKVIYLNCILKLNLCVCHHIVKKVNLFSIFQIVCFITVIQFVAWRILKFLVNIRYGNILLLWSDIWLFNFQENGCMKLHNNKKISFLWEIFQKKNNRTKKKKNIQRKRKSRNDSGLNGRRKLEGKTQT